MWLLVTELQTSGRAVSALNLCHLPLILTLGRQRQADLCDFEASLVYRVSARTVKAAQRNPV